MNMKKPKQKTIPKKKTPQKNIPKKKWLNGWNLFTVIVGIVTVIGTIYGVLAYKVYIRDKKIFPISGTIVTPRTAEKKILAIGSVMFEIKSDDNVFIRENSKPVISFHKYNDKLYISAIIRNTEGEIVAKLDENEWQLNLDKYYDRNFNHKALEIIDHFGKVVLQVVDFGDIIYFAGEINRKDGSCFALIPIGEYGSVMVIGVGNHKKTILLKSTYASQHPKISNNIPTDLKITPIFEYPSDKHLGVCPGMDSLEILVRKSNIDNYYEMTGPIDIGL